MRLGLTIPFRDVPIDELGPLVRRVEELGYDDLWSEESVNLDGVTPLAVAATASERLRLVSGVVNVYTRGPALLAQTAAALAELSGGRFVLGLGSSSEVVVERWNEVPFERPIDTVRARVEQLRSVLAGGRGAGGFRLARPPSRPVPIVLAALRPRMLALAGEIADGAFTNFLPLSGAGTVAATFAAAAAANRAAPGAPVGSGGGKELACRFFVVPGPAEEALLAARQLLVAYATVPVYAEFLRWLGWGEALAPMLAAWSAGERAAALELVPEALVREIFLFGPLEAAADRLAAFAEAGITTAVLALLVPPAELEPAIEVLASRRP